MRPCAARRINKEQEEEVGSRRATPRASQTSASDVFGSGLAVGPTVRALIRIRRLPRCRAIKFCCSGGKAEGGGRRVSGTASVER